jgi:hypothetical protein
VDCETLTHGTILDLVYGYGDAESIIPGIAGYANTVSLGVPPEVGIVYAVYLYAEFVSNFLQENAAAFNSSFPFTINMGLDGNGSIIPNLYISNASFSTFADVTFDPAAPGENCQISRSDVETLHIIFGRQNYLERVCATAAMFVVWYWVGLADLGQVTSQGATGQESNNIFVNETLFELYSSFINSTIIPHLNRPGWNTSFNILPVSETNKPLSNSPVSLYTMLTCSQRQIKGWVSFVVSVAAADTALILGVYNVFIFIAGWIQKRRDRKCKFA